MDSQRPFEPAPDPGMCGCDRDVFLRVWGRVMPEDRPDCPVTVETPAPEPAPEPCSAMAEPLPAVPDCAGDDFPARDAVPCLGSGAIPELERLQEFISCELAHWRAYQSLARRVSGPGGRTIAALAGGCRRRAKRLSAAQFLISGVRYWPSEQGNVPAPRSYFGALREHFLSEQNRGCAYRAAAEDCRDACLKTLYLDMVEECVEHTCRIRALLETM